MEQSTNNAGQQNEKRGKGRGKEKGPATGNEQAAEPAKEKDPIQERFESAQKALMAHEIKESSTKVFMDMCAERKGANGKMSPEDQQMFDRAKKDLEEMSKAKFTLQVVFDNAEMRKELAELKKLIKEGILTKEEGAKVEEALTADKPAEKSKEELEKEAKAEIASLEKMKTDDKAKKEFMKKYGFSEREFDEHVDAKIWKLKNPTEKKSEDGNQGGEKGKSEGAASSVEKKGEAGAESPAKPEEEKRYLPKEAEGVFKEAYEKQQKKEKGRSNWKFVWERLKGFATLGFWEFHQAEKFRTKTKDSAEDIMGDARGIKQVERLDLEAALEEAGVIREMAEEDKKITKDGGMHKNAIKKYSEGITAQKKEENGKLINTIIEQSTRNLEFSLKKYKDQFGDSAVTTDKLDAFRSRLRKELDALQRGFINEGELQGKGGLAMRGPSKVREAILAKPDAFKKTIRESLDSKYWKRYVYGGVEMF
ncbi:MAG: hypothetical protein UY41_C0014G0015, partial [Candidatus Moranbacteria bacterium GW2011_GWE1_49_15]